MAGEDVETDVIQIYKVGICTGGTTTTEIKTDHQICSKLRV